MADPQKVNKWVKFVGEKIGRWKTILDDISVDQVPLQYVVEVRYHHLSGEVKSVSIDTSTKHLGDDISKYVRDSADLKAVEFIVNIDQINQDIGEVVKDLLNFSQGEK